MKNVSLIPSARWSPLLCVVSLWGSFGFPHAESISVRAQGLVSTNQSTLEIDGEMEGLEKGPPAMEENPPALTWDAGWDQGFYYGLKSSTEPQRFLFWRPPVEHRHLEGRVGVKMHLDAATYDVSGDLLEMDPDADMRRTRVYTQGNTYFLSPMDYKVEFGVDAGKFFFSEGYVRWNAVPGLKTLQLGQFKAPMSMEMMTSSGATTFMERGLPVLAFAPGSRFGIQSGGAFINRRMTLVAGLYANVADLDVGDATDSALGPMARFTWAPLHGETNGVNRVLHFGASASYTESREDSFRYRARPESALAPYLVDTEEMSGKDGVLSGFELAAGRGPLLLQGEFLHSHLTFRDSENENFYGVYGLASWLLTGESRFYSSGKGIFGRLLPDEPFSWEKRQWGAWELATRFSMVDLSDKAIRGGRLRDVTVGANWYWTRDIRMMFNYVYSDLDQKEEDGHVHVFQTRLQVEF